ncbi:MAG: hypothetical protein J0M17_09530 [Planctomycetes bacterium]|nr:hypothetical protein [Planctomycetota bacterium]
MSSDAEIKGRRVTIDLTAAAALEVDRLRELTGLTTADLFRNAFSLFRIYVQARERGEEMCIVDPDDNHAIRTRIELPVVLSPRIATDDSAASRGAKQ